MVEDAYQSKAIAGIIKPMCQAAAKPLAIAVPDDSQVSERKQIGKSNNVSVWSTRYVALSRNRLRLNSAAANMAVVYPRMVRYFSSGDQFGHAFVTSINDEPKTIDAPTTRIHLMFFS